MKQISNFQWFESKRGCKCDLFKKKINSCWRALEQDNWLWSAAAEESDSPWRLTGVSKQTFCTCHNCDDLLKHFSHDPKRHYICSSSSVALLIFHMLTIPFTLSKQRLRSKVSIPVMYVPLAVRCLCKCCYETLRYCDPLTLHLPIL